MLAVSGAFAQTPTTAAPAQPTTTTVAPPPTAESDTAISTEAAPNRNESPKIEDSWLKTSHIIIAIVAAILGSAITAIVSAWKGVHWVVFTILERSEGLTKLIAIVEGELKKNPNDLMSLIYGELKKNPDELMKTIHVQLNTPTGHETLAKYCLVHFQAAGRKDYQDFILGVLDSREAEQRMIEIVARLTALRDKAKAIAEENVAVVQEATPPRSARESEEKARALGQTEIAGRSEDPLMNAVEMAGSLERIAAELRAGLKKQG